MESTESLIRTIAKFAGHIIGGIVIFMLVGGAALLLHYAVRWLASQGMPEVIISTFTGLEYLIFAADVLVFGSWIVVSTLVALKHISDIWERR